MNCKTISTTTFLAAILFFAASESARADAVWQALFFEPEVLSKTWWVIPVGLAIEFPAVLNITKFSPVKSAWVTILMNTASFLVGMILQAPSVALGGLAWYIFVFLVSIVGNTFIEATVIRRFSSLAYLPRSLALLAAVNALSVGLTLVVLLHNA